MEFTVRQIEDFREVAQFVASDLKAGDTVLLNGDMGAGKTTLMGFIASEIEISDQISSPTYAIVNSYKSKTFGNVHHFDCYRLDNEMEAIESGLDELIDDNGICFIEWSEKISKLLPDTCVEVNISVDGALHRHVTVNRKPSKPKTEL